jgi:acetylornithine deacetylase/succinyl-diaminopimelate desuccinylase-like protein
LGSSYLSKFPWILPSSKPMGTELTEQILSATWRPTLSYTGVDGIPSCKVAGNVLRPETSLTLSFRLPPSAKAEEIKPKIIKLLTENPPYGCQVSFDVDKCADGWAAPDLQPWLEDSLNVASQQHWGKGLRLQGEGGSIPFMVSSLPSVMCCPARQTVDHLLTMCCSTATLLQGMLGELFPKSQFVVTGLLGPASNAHGPNEFLNIQMYKHLTAAMSSVLADHYTAKVIGK